jgi:phospholipid/cholesterol/gamma-HCH transport system ATP-binding protein
MKNDNDKSPAIDFRNVSISFGDVIALNDVSFRLEKGEMICVTGVSGSGKSVLLKLAIGLLKPDAGEILIDGKAIDELGEDELLAIRGGSMGMVFQEDSLFTGLTVYENSAYRLEEWGWTAEQIDKAVSEVLEFVGLNGEEDKFPEELSGGMKRRLEIARALIGWPSIMLFDEATISLDPIVASQVLDLIIRTRDINQASSLYVTKKVHEIPYLAYDSAVQVKGDKESASEPFQIKIVEASPDDLPRTRVMLLESGKIAFLGTVEEFKASDSPTIKDLLALDVHDHSKDPYFADPWDKRRRPKEEIL